MSYEINVSKNGQHFFATALRSCDTREKAKKVYNELKKVFTEENGYKISVYYCETFERSVNLEVPEVEESFQIMI